uniref:Uncharacterized protein n=1 Tax=Anguilla anguilla TaxID=7936 RepID=A0A0E9X312_ANGAN
MEQHCVILDACSSTTFAHVEVILHCNQIHTHKPTCSACISEFIDEIMDRIILLLWAFFTLIHAGKCFLKENCGHVVFSVPLKL